jgi:hypothetical protein
MRDRVSALQRISEILRAIRSAKIPPPPRRRWDLISEAAARPFGENSGRGPIRRGGVVFDDDGRCVDDQGDDPSESSHSRS